MVIQQPTNTNQQLTNSRPGTGQQYDHAPSSPTPRNWGLLLPAHQWKGTNQTNIVEQTQTHLRYSHRGTGHSKAAKPGQSTTICLPQSPTEMKSSATDSSSASDSSSDAHSVYILTRFSTGNVRPLTPSDSDSLNFCGTLRPTTPLSTQAVYTLLAPPNRRQVALPRACSPLVGSGGTTLWGSCRFAGH